MRISSAAAIAMIALSLSAAGCGGEDTLPLSEVETGIKTDLQAQIREGGVEDALVSEVTCVKKGENEARCLADATGGGETAKIPLEVTLDGESYIWETEGGDLAQALAGLAVQPEGESAPTESANADADADSFPLEDEFLIDALGIEEGDSFDEGIIGARVEGGDLLVLESALPGPVAVEDITSAQCERIFDTLPDMENIVIGYSDFGDEEVERVPICE